MPTVSALIWKNMLMHPVNGLFAPENRQAVIDAMADPKCRIVTLTITEGGYYYVEGSGEFDQNHPTIQHDLHHPDTPMGVRLFSIGACPTSQSGIATVYGPVL